MLRRIVIACTIAIHVATTPCSAQEPEATTRTALLEQEQARKVDDLRPYGPDKAEKYLNYAETALTTGLKLHPFFQNAYAGGGFTLGAGYRKYVGAYENVDVRGSITLAGYKRFEAEFVAPRLFGRQGFLSVIGGWREATEVGYYGPGTSNSSDDRANYGFKQPHVSATLDFRPGRHWLLLRAGIEATEWQQTPGQGSAPPVGDVYTPDTLPGLGASVTYFHPLAALAAACGPTFAVDQAAFRDTDIAAWALEWS